MKFASGLQENKPALPANTLVGSVQPGSGPLAFTQMNAAGHHKGQKMDNLTTEMIERMSIQELAKLPPNVLNDLQWKVSDELVKARQRDNTLNQALELRYGGRAANALLADGRDTGTVHLADGRFDVSVTKPKRVKWDQAKLREALDGLPPETARHLAKVELKVDERIYAAAPPDIQQALAPARTVETGKTTFSLSQREAA